MNKIRILVVEPNQEPKVAKIKNELSSLQEIVNGLIEIVELECNVDIVCNEEGKINNLEVNRIITNDVICGTFFIVGQHKEDTISLSRKQIKKYKKIFRVNKDEKIINFLKQNVANSEQLLHINLYGIEKARVKE